MFRFGAVLTVALIALGLLVGGVLTSSLMLVYAAIGAAAIAGLLLLAGVLFRRDELFGSPRTGTEANEAGRQPVAAAAGSQVAGPSAANRGAGQSRGPAVAEPAVAEPGLAGGRLAAWPEFPAPAVPAGHDDQPARARRVPLAEPQEPAWPGRPAEPQEPAGWPGQPRPAPAQAGAQLDRPPRTADKLPGLPERPAASSPAAPLSAAYPESTPAARPGPADDDLSFAVRHRLTTHMRERQQQERATEGEPDRTSASPPAAAAVRNSRQDLAQASAGVSAVPAGKQPGPAAGAGKPAGPAVASPAGEAPGTAAGTGEASPVSPAAAAQEASPVSPAARADGNDRGSSTDEVAGGGLPAPASSAGTAAAGTKDIARGQVTVVPGIARYHRSGCTLIRFLGTDDLESMTKEAAEAGGCVPCRACQPDGPAPDDPPR